MEIISRTEAKEKGLKFYFTGKPCHLGHITKRTVSGWQCWACVSKGSEKYDKKLEKMREDNAKKKKLKQEQFLASLPIEIREKLITREEAREKGLNRYFTGVVCSEGHMAERETSGGQCVICKNEKQRERRATPEGKAQQKEEAKKRWADKEQRAKQIEARLKWAAENPERIKELRNNDWWKHREKYLEKQYAYNLERWKNDPLYRLRKNLAKRVINALKDQGTKKDDYTLNFVGCKIKELKKHIELQFKDGMQWDNYSHEVWHIDHIRPCSSFDFSNEDEVYLCFNWRNLQPLWASENNAKKDRYSKEDESAWVKRMKDLGYEGELFLKYQDEVLKEINE